MKRLKNKGIRIGTLIGVALLIAVLLVMLLPGGVVITPIGIPSVDSGVVLASPDTERQSPDVLIAQDNLTGTVTDIQDDPDSPDTNWLTFITEQSNTVCHVSFPTPTGNLTEGVDLQEFKVWARKDPGTGDPTIRIELYESGASLAILLSDTIVTSETGELFTGTWNANLLTSIDGSNVECYIFGTGVAGAPGVKTTVEIGAVEWNVDYTVAPSITNTPSEWNLGVVSEGGTYETTGGLTSAYFTVTNNSAFDVNITISGTDMIGGDTWELSEDASTGENIYGLKAGLEGGDYTIVVPEDTANTLVSGLAGGGGTQRWGLQFLAPTTFTDGASKSGTVTLTAAAA